MAEIQYSWRLMKAIRWSGHLGVVVAVILAWGMTSQVAGAVLLPAGDRYGAIPFLQEFSVGVGGNHLLEEAESLYVTIPLSGATGDGVGDVLTFDRRLALEAWTFSTYGVAPTPHAVGFNGSLFRGASRGSLVTPDIGKVVLKGKVPIRPVSSVPSSAMLFVPAVIGLLGVSIRNRSSDLPVTRESRDGPPFGDQPASIAGCILALSSDPGFLPAIREPLHRAGHRVQFIASLDKTITLMDHGSPALILVDHRVSDWDMLRTHPMMKHMPIMMLVPCSSFYTEEHYITDLKRGADGFHDFREGSRLFVAKVDAYLRRAGHEIASRGLYQLGALELDADIHEAKLAGQRLKLSAKPFAILKTLIQAPSRVFSRSELVDRVWGPQFAIGEHTLDVHVHALRRQLDRDPRRLCRLVTIKGVGFKLKAADSMPSSFSAAMGQAIHPVAANGTDGLRSTAGLGLRSSKCNVRSQLSPPQAPVRKGIPRRRSSSLARRPAVVVHIGNAILAG